MKDERTKELYECDVCKKLFTSVGTCHGHIQSHLGIYRTVIYSFWPNVEHLMSRTNIVRVKIVDRRSMEEE